MKISNIMVSLGANVMLINSMVIMDDEFEKIKELMHSQDINTMASKEHVGDIEWEIILVKYWSRAIIYTLPHKKYPNLVVVGFLHFVMMWIIDFLRE